MALSLNQVEHTARKAVRGAGLPWGLAEDAGRAVRWLEMLNLPGMLWLSQLLDTLAHDDLDTLRVRATNGEWRAAGDAMSPLLAGPSLMDWSGMQPSESAATLRLNDVACAGLCIGYLAQTASFRQTSVSLEADGNELIVGAGGVSIPPGDASWLCRRALRVIVTTGADSLVPDGVLYSARVGSRDIDPCALDMLESLAHNTYVEASEASRLSGAGAGLQDND